jgi:Family of unknown function (DUF5670)
MGGLMILAAILAVMWIVGLVAFKTAGFLIHILLIAAVISFVIGLLGGRRAV